MTEEMDYKVDREGWAKGPWDDEPDRLEWRDQVTGMPCLIVRSGTTGALCGYVGVPPSHADHGKHWQDVEGVDVHGGLTYSSKCAGPICHVAAPGEPDDVWWLGFDCAHHLDAAPGHDFRMAMIPDLPKGFRDGNVYRDVAYVRAETTRLARQLGGMA